jgi:hypothetical protein
MERPSQQTSTRDSHWTRMPILRKKRSPHRRGTIRIWARCSSVAWSMERHMCEAFAAKAFSASLTYRLRQKRKRPRRHTTPCGDLSDGCSLHAERNNAGNSQLAASRFSSPAATCCFFSKSSSTT